MLHLSFLLWCCFAQYFAAKVNDGVGFINPKGEIVYKLPKGYWAQNMTLFRYFTDGFIQFQDRTKESNLCGIIRYDGKIIVEPKYKLLEIGYLSEGLIRLSNGNKWGYVM